MVHGSGEDPTKNKVMIDADEYARLIQAAKVRNHKGWRKVLALFDIRNVLTALLIASLLAVPAVWGQATKQYKRLSNHVIDDERVHQEDLLRDQRLSEESTRRFQAIIDRLQKREERDAEMEKQLNDVKRDMGWVRDYLKRRGL